VGKTTTTAEVALRSTGIGIFTTFIMTPMVMEKAGQFLTIALKKLIFQFQIKDKELIIRFKNNRQQEEINVLRKKGVDYSSLDPFVGYWQMTKATVGQTEAIVQEGKCLNGEVVASSLGFTLYLKAPDKSGQCQTTVETFKWVKEGNKYYDITDPQKKEELAFVFSENNTKLSYSTPSDNGLVTIYLTKVK